ncbi:outer-membrane lipoprotein carrier protein precursor [bacterium BMS3Bbin06]|nr:outer-membrane lipoprotein carrier protein precursor [bacterium BMS3Bbin06]HDH01090.1 outer membrane lipoprotein carrier protein LolA [Nitrospirota bacterium]
MMKTSLSYSPVIAAVLLLLMFNTAFSINGSALQRLKRSYLNIETLKGGFVQKTYINDLKKNTLFKGEFYLKRPGLMRWNYTSGSSDTVYLKGDEIIIYQPSESQAFISDINRFGMERSPLRILLNLDDIEKDYSVKEEGNRIILHPKGSSVIRSLELVLDEAPFPVKRIIFSDRYGNRTEIEVMDLTVNGKIPEATFTFKLPEGTTLIRQ